LPSYSYTHTCRAEKKGGGTAIYIKDSIDYEIVYWDKNKINNIEATGIKFKTRCNSRYIALLSVYIPPGVKISSEELNNLIINENTIIVGDLNGKHKLWGSSVIDTRGKQINEFIETNNLICLNKGEGTRMNYNGTLSHLDLTLCSIHLATGLNCEVLDDTWGSDHFPLCVTMTQNIPKTVLSTKNKQNFNKADWALFKTCIHDELQKVDSYDAGDATEMYHELIAKLKLASKKSIPIKNSTFKHKYSSFWNSECSK